MFFIRKRLSSKCILILPAILLPSGADLKHIQYDYPAQEKHPDKGCFSYSSNCFISSSVRGRPRRLTSSAASLMRKGFPPPVGTTPSAMISSGKVLFFSKSDIPRLFMENLSTLSNNHLPPSLVNYPRLKTQVSENV